MSRIPLIIILGATGSGKSKLAIEIAKKYGGEIVNADAMQLYKELNIITNKVSSEEQNQAPHHLLDISDPLKHVNVVDYRNMAIPILDDLLERRILPLVVGGTNYYIESILWKVLVEDRNLKRPLSIDDIEVGAEKKWKSAEEFAEQTGPELHSQLEKVDPDRAKTLHPNDRRKIIRSLQVFAEHGRTHSSMLKEQKETSGGNELGGPLRYPHSCILWLQCDQEVLDHRLVSRVDTMLEQGLVQELINFHQLYNKDRLSTGTPHDYTTGIFQSIGFKEFHDFLMLNEEERESPEGKRLFQRGLEEMKLATRRYARKQLKWIRNRFLRRPNRPVPNVYGLDGTDPSQWDEKVLNRALSIVDSYMKGETPSSIEPLSLENSLNNANNSEFCTVCRRVFIGRLQLEAHLNSKKHQKMERRVALAAPEQGKLPGESGSMKEIKEEIKKESVEKKPQENVLTNTIKAQTN